MGKRRRKRRKRSFSSGGRKIVLGKRSHRRLRRRVPEGAPQEGDFHSGAPFFYGSLCHTVHIPKCPKPLINCATLFQSVQLIAHWGRKVGHFRGHFRSHRQCHFLGAFRGQMTFPLSPANAAVRGRKVKNAKCFSAFLEDDCCSQRC